VTAYGTGPRIAATRLAEFYRDRPVLVTGHSGLLGQWVVALLTECCAVPHGLASGRRVGQGAIPAACADIRDLRAVRVAMAEVRPVVVVHLAAQSHNRNAQRHLTYETNVLGTVNVLESAAELGVPSCVVASSSRDWRQAQEDGEFWDPYNASKLAAEQVTLNYRHDALRADTPRGVAIARPAVLIGGGDTSPGRLVPSVMRALMNGQAPGIANAASYRPWQHAIESAAGLLWLGAALADPSRKLAPAYNFGMPPGTASSVGSLVGRLEAQWSGTPELGTAQAPEVTGYWLDFDGARADLGWLPCWTLDAAAQATVEWYRASQQDPAAVRDVMREQVLRYARSAAAAGAEWAIPSADPGTPDG
jgi:CDP-glucose 4,6-dehydratase